MDDHCVVAWANMTTVGVLPAAKYDWFLTSISNLLAAYPRNGLAIVVHCNRASDPSRSLLPKSKFWLIWFIEYVCCVLSFLYNFPSC